MALSMELCKYSRNRPSESQSTTRSSRDLNWWHCSHPGLCVSIEHSTEPKNTAPSILKVYLKKDIHSVEILENIDLASVRSLNSLVVPLKAVFRGAIVGLRYLHTENPAIFHRFQLRFLSTAHATQFVQAIKPWCPCRSSNDQCAPETQLQVEQRFDSQLPAQTPITELSLDKNMASSSFSGPSEAKERLTLADMLERDKVDLIRSKQLQDLIDPQNPTSSAVPGDRSLPINSSVKEQTYRQLSHESRRGTSAQSMQLPSIGLIQESLKQKSFTIRQFNKESWTQAIVDVIMDDGFADLVKKVGNVISDGTSNGTT